MGIVLRLEAVVLVGALLAVWGCYGVWRPRLRRARRTLVWLLLVTPYSGWVAGLALWQPAPVVRQRVLLALGLGIGCVLQTVVYLSQQRPDHGR